MTRRTRDSRDQRQPTATTATNRGPAKESAAPRRRIDAIDSDDPFTRDAPAAASRAQPADQRRRRHRGGGQDAGFDPGILPPSIARDEEPAKRPSGRGRRRPRPDEDGEEALEAVS